MDNYLKNKFVKTIAITSGKGGVGKTNITANLAMEISKKGFSVMILDADLGLSNIDILFQITPKYNLQHVLNGQMNLQDIVVEGPNGIKILPASSGVQELTALNEFQRLKLLEGFDSYNVDIDYFLIDTAAGISENVAFFCVAAQEIVVVTTPEPTSLTDAYALIKVLFTKYQEKEFRVLVNLAKNPEEAFGVFKNLSKVAERFLSISLDYIGYIPFDNSLKKAVKAQKPVVDIFPDSIASKQFSIIADRFLNHKNTIKGSLQFFIGNLLSVNPVTLQKT
ncbi:MAG: MinD/ParA family protein [Nitrospirae bacterium]|jgi:flagellar biosynthesis protein FlhG|nr:MinD/ParA family protein [Nitrospirota bacterium]